MIDYVARFRKWCVYHKACIPGLKDTKGMTFEEVWQKFPKYRAWIALNIRYSYKNIERVYHSGICKGYCTRFTRCMSCLLANNTKSKLNKTQLARVKELGLLQ